jgi:hypothetical protein
MLIDIYGACDYSAGMAESATLQLRALLYG